MIRGILIEVVHHNRQEEDKTYRRKAAEIMKRHGIEVRVWRVEGRRIGEVLVDWGEFDSHDQMEERIGPLFADPEWQALEQEREAAGTILPGSMEELRLVEY